MSYKSIRSINKTNDKKKMKNGNAKTKQGVAKKRGEVKKEKKRGGN
jgi:hypothetical protein